jgi:hypothetical protein
VARYLLRRLLALGPTLIGVSVLAFLFLRLVPGDAIAVRLGTSTVLTPQQMAELRIYLGLDRPLPLQYLGWLGALLRGDAGYSLRTGQPVVGEIASRLPVTMELALAAAVIALLIGLPLGILSALRPHTGLDFVARGFWAPRSSRCRTSGWARSSSSSWRATSGGCRTPGVRRLPLRTPGPASSSSSSRHDDSAWLPWPSSCVRTHAIGQPPTSSAQTSGPRTREGLGAPAGRHHALRNSLIVVVTILGVQVSTS